MKPCVSQMSRYIPIFLICGTTARALESALTTRVAVNRHTAYMDSFDGTAAETLTITETLE